MIPLLGRKQLVQTLGVASLGIGLLAGAAGAPLALAQEHEQQSPGPELQLLQYEERSLDLSEEELQQLLIQLLFERSREKESAPVFLGDEDARDFVVAHRRGDDSLEVEVYNEFTQALADELGIADPDEVDAAIRGAMMAGVDANEGLSEEGAEEMKALIAAAAAPIGPTIRGWGG